MLIPYFCITTDISSSKMKIHQTGKTILNYMFYLEHTHIKMSFNRFFNCVKVSVKSPPLF